ncbi:hypothetical protein Mal15_28440 [Stieleria maiorica]|uniref:Uncharacterized protein n=1 Tax=Stieleria maiorica TaxID=2795974 RepID=A0A5B9MCN4_9BACT|nr:hypothetical protein [Stieleria maiorica]QEF98788.1 hypothetical protein Mal15_28440 [Stieleria maiorica]
MTNPYRPPESRSSHSDERKPIQWRGYLISGGAIVAGIVIVLVIELLGIKGELRNYVLIGLLLIGSLVGSHLVEKTKRNNK